VHELVIIETGHVDARFKHEERTFLNLGIYRSRHKLRSAIRWKQISQNACHVTSWTACLNCWTGSC